MVRKTRPLTGLGIHNYTLHRILVSLSLSLSLTNSETQNSKSLILDVLSTKLKILIKLVWKYFSAWGSGQTMSQNREFLVIDGQGHTLAER